MSFTAAVFEALSGKQARYHSVSTGTMLDALAEKYGSNVKVGQAIGVSEAAIRRWRKGATPRNRTALVHGYRKITMRAGREAELRDGLITLHMTQNDGGGDAQRARVIKGAGLALAPGTMDAVMDAYFDGDDFGAAEALYDGIGDTFYHDWIVPDFEDFPDLNEYDGYALY